MDNYGLFIIYKFVTLDIIQVKKLVPYFCVHNWLTPLFLLLIVPGVPSPAGNSRRRVGSKYIESKNNPL
jgi:hypothetical protein